MITRISLLITLNIFAHYIDPLSLWFIPDCTSQLMSQGSYPERFVYFIISGYCVKPMFLSSLERLVKLLTLVSFRGEAKASVLMSG